MCVTAGSPVFEVAHAGEPSVEVVVSSDAALVMMVVAIVSLLICIVSMLCYARARGMSVCELESYNGERNRVFVVNT